MIRAIFACDDDWGIGRGNQLPWPNNSSDLKWFKENTLNSVIVMGRNTWESLPKKPLPNRMNVIVSSQNISNGPNIVLKPNKSVDAVKSLSDTNDVWIIGGEQTLEVMFPIVDEIWLSRINGSYDCDTFLPKTYIELSYSMIQSEKQGDLYIEKWRKIECSSIKN